MEATSLLSRVPIIPLGIILFLVMIALTWASQQIALRVERARKARPDAPADDDVNAVYQYLIGSESESV